MRFDNQLAIIQANREKEINSMQHCLVTIKVDNDKVIKGMEAGQICLQNKLLTMEENHAKEVNARKVEHSTQMDAITIQVHKFQHGSEDRRNKETSIDPKPPCLLQQAPSYYEVICSIEKWLIEGGHFLQNQLIKR